MSDEVDDLVERISDKADLCRNDGADDIADLLREAGVMISRLNRVIATAKHKLEYADGPAMVRVAYETLRSMTPNAGLNRRGEAASELKPLLGEEGGK